MSLAHSPSIVTNGLVFCLDAANTKSYNAGISTTTWNDVIGGNNATLTNGPTFSSANSGSIVFDGVNDRVATATTLPNAYGLFADSTSFWSASSWFITDFSNTTNGAIIGKSGGVGVSAPFVVYIPGSGTALRCVIRGTLTIISSTLSTNWNEFVITWDGTTGRSYLNGNYVVDVGIGTAPQLNNVFTVGNVGSSSVGIVTYKGNISNVKVYNRALSASEISQNFNALRGRYGL